MRRYYFNVRDDDHSLDDDTGEVHRTIDAAEAKGRQIARELSDEPETYRGYSIVVIDEDGKMVASIPIISD
jgi:hypothetical protein